MDLQFRPAFDPSRTLDMSNVSFDIGSGGDGHSVIDGYREAGLAIDAVSHTCAVRINGTLQVEQHRGSSGHRDLPVRRLAGAIVGLSIDLGVRSYDERGSHE